MNGYKQTTNMVLNLDQAANNNLRFSEIINVPHDVRKITSRCIVAFEQAALRENDPLLSYVVELENMNLILGAGITRQGYCPEVENVFSDAKKFSGEYTVIVRDEDGATINLASASNITVILTFHEHY